jgi:hypothetical protein
LRRGEEEDLPLPPAPRAPGVEVQDAERHGWNIAAGRRAGNAEPGSAEPTGVCNEY